MQIHSNIQAQLFSAIEKEKISHTLLFHGKAGYGVLPLAIWYAQQLICLGKGDNCHKKVGDLQHADLHFCFPVVTTDEVKKPNSASFLSQWRQFVKEQPFGSGYDWVQFIGAEKKKGIINVDQAHEILQNLSLRSYEGGYRVMIIWYPETMNNATANKLLKILEEPTQNSVFILVSEKIDELLPTLLSRCQIFNIQRLTETEVKETLIQYYDVEPNLASQISREAQGDISVALEALLFKKEEFETYFISWVRNAFKAKNDISALKEILNWSLEIDKWSRERQGQFLMYCAEIFRRALIQNYGAGDYSNSLINSKFKWNNFLPFIHGANIEDIINEINEAAFHIERNANGKIVFLDLGIKMTRFIHKKEAIEG